MPPARSNEELADEFTNFFLDKITKIREQFADKLIYEPPASDTPRLRKFSPMMEAEVNRVINGMHSKSCELDAMPTTLLKKLMNKCLPCITKIVNISLTQGIFCE